MMTQIQLLGNVDEVRSSLEREKEKEKHGTSQMCLFVDFDGEPECHMQASSLMHPTAWVW